MAESSVRYSPSFTTSVGAKENPVPSPVEPEGTQHKQFPDLHALIIGIDEYKNSTGNSGFKNLNYSVSDADAIANLLEVKLGVPKENIRNLRNGEATRKQIIEEIKVFASEDKIKPGSPMFIFYAGHGATSKHVRSELQYEVLCPADVTTSPDPRPSDPYNNTVSGIPDYEIQKLINEVSKKKGNNIAFFLDCCHSAGMNRKGSSGNERRMHSPTPLSDVDFPVVRGNRAGGIIPKAVGRNHQSHVLLSACGKNQTEKECSHVEHGWFTKSLLELIGKVPIENLTYDTLLSNIDVTCRVCTQYGTAGYRRIPHCDGSNIERKLFSTNTVKSLIRGIQADSGWVIPCGSLTGILPQARFNIYASGDPLKEPLGTLIATNVTAGSTKLDFSLNQTKFSIPSPFFAELVSRFTDFSVFCCNGLDLNSIFPKYEYFGIVSSDDKESADAFVEYEEESGNMAVYRGQKRPENQDLGNLLRKVSPMEIPRTLHDAAAFYHHLNRIGPTKFDQVTVKMVNLIVDDELGQATGIDSTVKLETHPGLLFSQRATVIADSILDDSKLLWTKPLGLQIYNSSDEDLYPYVFVFFPSSLKIAIWHSVTHAERPDSPLPRKSSLSIGFEGTASPWGFYLDPENSLNQDVAYIKIFFTTAPNSELEHIEQDPFKAEEVIAALTTFEVEVDDERGPYPGMRPKVPPIMPILCQWGVHVIEVVQRLKEAS